ncbi:uncharacterized protein A1O9_02608 [Exophiala aquamarina CBS 119918]|uniref:Autophagy-related protein 11 n=1 Tax=Exophiala aquamarina CBS 119918 TaxID=1182545 RepID=A0A072PLR0_9EURO|nr:uncharacterized protein A1O9_02608 [Exophiala aquamarina CBS 119918]KEF61044.1 hypothetical protein A1O9_02608 [Exophiala aquamarina CBS 119918]
MALQVYISHTGAALPYNDPSSRVDALRSWIEAAAAIPVNRQILMTARGKIVKNLANESEVFVYDKEFLGPNSNPPPNTNPNLDTLQEPPSSLADETSLGAWHELFKSRQGWAADAFDIARAGVENLEVCADEATVIARSMKVALDNLRTHIIGLQQKFEETKQWAEGYIQEHREVLKDWQGSADVLAELPVREDVVRILRRSAEPDSTRANTPIGTLFDLIDRDGLQSAATRVEQTSNQFEKNLRELQSSITALEQDAERAQPQDPQIPDIDTHGLLEEAETIAKRIRTDMDDVLQMPDNQKSVVAVSRKAAVHTRELLPALQGVVEEIIQASMATTDARNNASAGWYLTLQNISRLQSRLQELQPQITNLDFTANDDWQALNRIFQLPLVYGDTLIEATRRSEWTEKMRVEVEGLHDDLLHQTEEEQRRRKKWTAAHSDFLSDDLNAKDALIDLKTSSPRNSWPFVNRDEIFAWIDDLRALGIDDTVQAITQRLKDLDAVVRKQRSKPFKNGSIHDLSQSAALRNGDEIRSLHDERSRLEEKLRASDSRVRKLEDLLHRQSQLSRPASGIFVPGSAADFERQAPSPSPYNQPSDLSRRSSVSTRRMSNTQDDKLLVQKILSLEGHIQKLQDEAHAERRSSTESRDKMQEAESIKRDLMANFEAQKQEFEDERQLLDDEVHRLKVKMEEAEDELDRLNESRDHLRNMQEENIADLRNELEQLKKGNAEEQAQSQRKLESAQKDISLQRDKASNLERQIHQIKEERATAQSQNLTLANQIRAMEDRQQEYVGILQVVHSNLSPAGSAPEDLRRLVNALEILSEGAAIHARGLDDSLQLAIAENKALEEKVIQGEYQIKSLTSRLSAAETRASETRENLDQEKSKVSALRSELASERTEMHSLREKFAAGETGSGALRQQLQSEEQKVVDLMESKASDESSIQKLRYEVENLTQDLSALNERQEKLKKHHDKRGEKAKQLSERLFHHHDRIIRMLEQFGYSVSRQDDALVIQRASKVNASSTMISGAEGSSSMRRTISGSVPPQHYSDPSDLETLYWMSDTDVANENNKYQSFVTALQRLDVDTTIDLITKRYKDVETLAKKYQKDARGYRERTHRLQAEAHDKIAYRSFKEGDLALFLPTRNQATRPWAAFNVGAPHYFLREQDAHKLQARDWLLARITKVEDRLVDLSRSMRGSAMAEASDAGSLRSTDDENPFELSDGLRWYLIDAVEEKLGAPGTPSLGKSTVSASNVEVKGHMGREKQIGASGSGTANTTLVTKTLTKSLDSRRSSSGSKKSMDLTRKRGEASSSKDIQTPLAPIVSDTDAERDGNSSTVRRSHSISKDNGVGSPSSSFAAGAAKTTGMNLPPSVVRQPSETGQTDREDAHVFEVVRRDLLLGP